MSEMREFRKSERLMGSAFEFLIVASEDHGVQLLNDAVTEVKRIETLLTEFSPDSETSKINAAAGDAPVTVSEETYGIIQRALDISKLTQGAFDITAVALRKLYNFKGEQFELPNDKKIRNALKQVGYKKLLLSSPDHVQLKDNGMRIGFGGIGKGYAADKVKSLLTAKGVEHGVINASGDLTAWGNKLDGSHWKVAVADPNLRDNVLVWLPLVDASVATSGDYEQFFEHRGIRYSHTIDPKTGHPIKGIKSVTVVCPSAELCDALATAVSIMGVEVGLHFVEQLPKTHCLIINDNNKVFTSKDLKINLSPQ